MSDSGDVPATAVRVRPGRALGKLAAPGSKSVTNRLLVVAALADGQSRLREPLDSDDSRAMRGVVTALGARVDDEAGAWVVGGVGGRPRAPRAPLDCGLSGTTMRFGTALAALADGPVTVTGAAPLLRRPIGALTTALRTLGAGADDDAGLPPVRLSGGGLAGGRVSVDVTTSSQFASALLLAAPYARDADVWLRPTGEAAHSYIELTAAAMRDWGIAVRRDGDAWVVPHGSGYAPRDVLVEYDASAAAHLFCLATASGGAVTVTNTDRTLQADAGFPQLCERMGAGVTRDGSALTVRGPRNLGDLAALGPLDLGAMPDQLPCLAVLAALAQGVTEIRNVAVVRGHETDRITALATELGRLDVDVTELPDGLRIRGGVPNGPDVRLRTYDDHRLAMAFAALATRTSRVVIEEPWCVTKTYPHFWSDAQWLGLVVEPA